MSHVVSATQLDRHIVTGFQVHSNHTWHTGSNNITMSYCSELALHEWTLTQDYSLFCLTTFEAASMVCSDNNIHDGASEMLWKSGRTTFCCEMALCPPSHTVLVTQEAGTVAVQVWQKKGVNDIVEAHCCIIREWKASLSNFTHINVIKQFKTFWPVGLRQLNDWRMRGRELINTE